MEKQICNSCGRTILKTYKICPFCGNLLNRTSSAVKDSNETLYVPEEPDMQETVFISDINDDECYSPQSNPTQQYPNETVDTRNNIQPEHPAKHAKSGNNVFIVILLIVVVIMAFMILLILMNNQNDKELEAEREKAKQAQLKMEKLQKDTERIQQQTDSLIAANETKRKEDSIRTVQAKIAEQKAREQEAAAAAAEAAAAEAAAQMAVPLSERLNGSHNLTGIVKGKRGERYRFKLWLNIIDGDVSGSFETSANEGPVRGYVDDSGHMVVYELDYDYDETGYYWSGQFNGKSYSGTYHSYGETDNLTFTTN